MESTIADEAPAENEANALDDFMREVIPEASVTRVLAGIVYPVDRARGEGRVGEEGAIIDTDGREVRENCTASHVLPLSPPYVRRGERDLDVEVSP